MSAETLVAALEQKGARLTVEGEKLTLQVPADKVPGPETIAQLRENKIAVLKYLRGRSQNPAIQFVSLPDPIPQQTDKLGRGPNATVPSHARTPAAACGSPNCAGCYEVVPGVRLHPPKCGAKYRKWRERWEAMGRPQ